MSVLQPFNPAYTQGITVSPLAVAANSKVGDTCKTLCLTNIGTVPVYVRPYDSRTVVSTPTATAADYIIPVGGQVTITKSQDFDSLTYIGAVGGSLHVIPGEGW